jgi:hypothetical protein
MWIVMFCFVFLLVCLQEKEASESESEANAVGETPDSTTEGTTSAHAENASSSLLDSAETGKAGAQSDSPTEKAEQRVIS